MRQDHVAGEDIAHGSRFTYAEFLGEWSVGSEREEKRQRYGERRRGFEREAPPIEAIGQRVEIHCEIMPASIGNREVAAELGRASLVSNRSRTKLRPSAPLR